MTLSLPTKINLLDFNHHAMKQLFIEMGEKPFRATQLLQWIHRFGITDFNQMTNFSKALRQRLNETAEIKSLDIALEKISDDGTYKWLLRLADGNCVETVFIPEKDRGTLCVSSQVGCILDCSFCSTGKQGFSRNLTVAEIIGQVWLASRRLALDYPDKQRVITNVVMMGMGEPLLNFDAVVKAMDIMMDDMAYNLSKYRVTLSTSGVVPAMLELKQQSSVALAVSLHAPNDSLRNQLVPLNKKYPLSELLLVCKTYFQNEPRRQVMFEYVMLDGVNDSSAHANQLIKLIKDIPCKVNLIPFNPFPFTNYQCSSYETILEFKTILSNAGIRTMIRKTRGDDVDAACGQLTGDVKDRTRRADRWKRKVIPIVNMN